MRVSLAAPLTATQQVAVAETYIDSQHVIERTVRSFIKTHRGFMNLFDGTIDDLIADGNTIFLEAWGKYDGGIAWDLHLSRWVWYTLFDDMRTMTRRAAVHAKIGGDAVLELAVPTDFSVEDLLGGLGTDAAMVVGCCLDVPWEIADIVQAKGGTACNLRSTMRGYLKDLGWTAKRVASVFTEIKEALA